MLSGSNTEWEKLLEHNSQLWDALRALSVESSQTMEPMGHRQANQRDPGGIEDRQETHWQADLVVEQQSASGPKGEENGILQDKIVYKQNCLGLRNLQFMVSA